MDFQVDLTNCDREPIHIPGKVQAHGVLLGFNRQTRIITHVSDNAATLLGLEPAALLDHDLDAFLTEKLGNKLTSTFLLQFEDIRAGSPERENSLQVKINGRELYLVQHSVGDTIILEFEPVQEHNQSYSQHIIGSLVTRILAAHTVKDTLAYAASQVKDIIGFDRVMIYKFAEDGHGHVVAEAVNPGFEPFLDLHYPASDIPKQARELYKKNLVRIIANVDAVDARIEVNNAVTGETPLDLSDSVLRAVSPMHIQYLKNMGVQASFSVSLISNGELWGLIACHNYAPALIDYKKRDSCKIIGQVLSSSLIFREEEENKDQRLQFLEHVAEIITAVRRDISIPQSLTGNKVNILQVSDASGAALIFENNVYTLGATPSHDEIRELAEWLGGYNKSQFYQTTSLSSEFAPAKNYKHVASGLMSCAISRELGEYMFWFKKEMPQTVKWAGDPHKPVEILTDGTQQLTPRKSFEIWSELVEGISEPWSKNEITAALKLMSELVQILNDRANQIRKLNEQLKQAYDELDTFSFTISHDLKTPLASIKNYSELLLEDHLSPEEYKPTVEKIIRGADRMTLLIKEVLSYSRIGRMAINFQELDMKSILEDIKQELLTIYKDNQVEIDIQHTFPLSGDQTMIYQVFTNIIGNAVKYSSKTGNGKVVVNSTANADEVTYTVSDNGIGIDMKNGDQIFELFHRMQNAKGFEGTGVGLAIVKRIITRHKGRIWYESEPGHGTIFYLSFKTNT